jgi:uncharacterized protein (DUF58 family)
MQEAADERDPELAELLAEVRRIDVQSRRLVRDVMSGGYVSVFRGAGLSFDTVREYAEGDDPRTLDWNVTARMGRPFVKTYVEERERTVFFLLDLSASMRGGLGLWSARQTAARVLACLALSAVKNGDKVGLIAFREGVVAYVPPAKGAGHALRIVRDALALPAEGTRSDPAPALDLATRAVRRHAVVFLISDFLEHAGLGSGGAGGSRGPGGSGGAADRALARCARRHDVVAVRLLGPELDPPAAGLARVRDPESGAELLLDLASPRVRAAYAARVAAWRAGLDATFARARVDVLDMPVPRAPGKNLVAGPILTFFRMRETRGLKR